MTTGKKHIVCCNFSPNLAKTSVNRRRILQWARELADSGSAPDIIVFPELALSGYLLESLVSESAMTLTEVEEFAAELAESGLPGSTEFILGLPLREGGEIFNAAVVLAGGSIKHVHRKLFLPTYGMFDEGRYFTRGTRFEFYQGNLGKTMLLICEDAWHAELAYAASVAAADTVIVISASPARGETGGNDFASTVRWRNRLQTFAESYGQMYVYCNRGGVEDGVLFDASSFVVDHEANFLVANREFQNSTNYFSRDRTQEHVGFSGNSSRQNDRDLILRILATFQSG
jgi:predicted amidohydrolase